MSIIEFTVPGNPVPKARPRVVEGRNGQRRAITPRRTKSYEGEVGWAYRVAYSGAPHEGPVAVEASIREGKRSPQQEGDIDNYGKAILDALNEIAWHDDRQVVTAHFEIERGARYPGVDVRVTTGPDIAQPTVTPYHWPDAQSGSSQTLQEAL